MEVIISTMSQISVPEEILNELDIPNLLKSFSEDYKRLDDIKHAREKHESRNWLGRLWNSNELEDAQLSAVEVQASFSKKIGQLMMISIAQSQMLHQQQQKLQSQQNEIKKQTEDIAAANGKISDQQNLLSEQQAQLEHLINEYFELKGLTVDGAKQLITIANEVKQTKAELVGAFEKEHQEVLLVKKDIEGILNEQLSKVVAYFEEAQRFAEQLKANLQQELQSTLSTMEKKLESYSEDSKKTLGQVQSDFQERLNANAQELLTHQAKIEVFAEKIQSDITSQQALVSESVGFLQSQINNLKWIAIAGVSTAAFSLALLVWFQRSAFGL